MGRLLDRETHQFAVERRVGGIQAISACEVLDAPRFALVAFVGLLVEVELKTQLIYIRHWENSPESKWKTAPVCKP
jgi:hypothetical protein